MNVLYAYLGTNMWHYPRDKVAAVIFIYPSPVPALDASEFYEELI